MERSKPITSGGYRICPLCRQRPATVQLCDAWVCGDCRSAFGLRRAVAFGIDLLLLFVLIYLPDAALRKGMAKPAIVVAWQWLAVVFFFFKDSLWGGSPGKLLMDLRVWDTRTHQPVGILASLQRNLILLVPGVNLVVALLVLNGTRVGDRWAGTTVVWRRYVDHYPFSAEPGRFCTECGYDLTGNRSGRCPECGWRIPGTSSGSSSRDADSATSAR